MKEIRLLDSSGTRVLASFCKDSAMEHLTTGHEGTGRAITGQWAPQGEGDAQIYAFGDFRIRWLPYAQCWRGTHHGETVITASDLRAVMDYCEGVSSRPK